MRLIELDQKSCHLMVEAWINGIPVNMIVDTGASRTVFDNSLDGDRFEHPAHVDSENLQSSGITTGNIQSRVAIAESFKLGDLELFNFPVVLIDLQEVSKLYLKVSGKDIHGLLGSDFLQEWNAVIDYEKSALILKKNDYNSFQIH